MDFEPLTVVGQSNKLAGASLRCECPQRVDLTHSHTAANGRLWRNLPFTRTLMKVGRHRFLPTYPLLFSDLPDPANHAPLKRFTSEIAAADYLLQRRGAK